MQGELLGEATAATARILPESDWQPAEQALRAKYGKGLADVFTDDKYQLMHIEMFPHHIIHAECVGGDIDLLLNERVTIGCFPWKFVDGEASISRIVAMVEDDRYEKLMAKKAKCKLTKFGDIDAGAPESQFLYDEAKSKKRR